MTTELIRRAERELGEVGHVVAFALAVARWRWARWLRSLLAVLGMVLACSCWVPLVLAITAGLGVVAAFLLACACMAAGTVLVVWFG